MPSVALQRWLTVRAARLDEIEAAHRSVGGAGPGRRYATQQINQAYAVLVAAHFQGFCRDLYEECAAVLVGSVTPVALRLSLQAEFGLHRALDRGNANPGNIGADFNRLGPPFWPLVLTDDGRNASRRESLEALNEWRNAIAHQSFDPARLGGTTVLRLRRVREWRGACDGLARSFDNVMRVQLGALTGSAPW